MAKKNKQKQPIIDKSPVRKKKAKTWVKTYTGKDILLMITERISKALMWLAPCGNCKKLGMNLSRVTKKTYLEPKPPVLTKCIERKKLRKR